MTNETKNDVTYYAGFEIRNADNLQFILNDPNTNVLVNCFVMNDIREKLSDQIPISFSFLTIKELKISTTSIIMILIPLSDLCKPVYALLTSHTVSGYHGVWQEVIIK